jgi:hypothetical protein
MNVTTSSTTPGSPEQSGELWAQPARRYFTQLSLRAPPTTPLAPWGEQRAEQFFTRLRAGAGLVLNAQRTEAGTGLESLDAFNAFKWD